MTQRRAVIAISFIVSFLTPFMASSVTIAAKTIADEFAMSGVMLNWINNSFLLATTVFLLPVGRMADLYGRKKFLAAGIAVFSLASLMVAASPSPAWLIACRALQGAGGAMIFSTSVALLTSVVPPAERGRMLGINTAAIYSGLSLGPVASGFLTHHLGWRSLFLIPLPLSAWALVLLWRHLRTEWADARGESFDLAGAVMYGGSPILLMFGFTFVSFSVAAGAAAIAGGIVLLAAFLYHQSGRRNPLLQVALLSRNRVFAFSNLAALVNYSATFALTFIVALYLQNVKGYSPVRTALVMVVQPILQAVFSPLAGRLSDRVDARYVASAGMGFCTLGLFVFVFLTAGTPVSLIVANLSLLGLGFAAFSSPNTNAVMGAVEKRDYGIAASILATMRMMGQMLSQALFTLLVALFLGKAPLKPENAAQFLKAARAAFVLFSVLCFGGIFASLARGRNLPQEKPGC